jgi:predicted DsbA family dithiol-disulfide isomerase
MHVEIWSDVVCPWCYLGKRRFEHALAQFAHRDDVEVVWRSFELDPTSPRSTSGTLTELLAQKMGTSVERAAAGHARLAALGAEEGLEYRFDSAKPGNTFDAHRMIHLAAAHRLQAPMKERLMRAYFTDGLPIADRETLVTLASEVGLDAVEAREMLAGDDYADAVREDERRAARLGITGVPFYVFDEKYGVSGAQPTALFREVIEQVWTESHPLMTAVPAADEAATCEGDSCAIPD